MIEGRIWKRSNPSYFKVCFYELNLHRVGLDVISYNKDAIELYKKMGFQMEGCERSSAKRWEMF